MTPSGEWFERQQRENSEFLSVLREAMLRANLAHPRIRPSDWRRLADMAGAGSGVHYPLKNHDGRWISFVTINSDRKWVREREEDPTRRLLAAGVFKAGTVSDHPNVLEVEWWPRR